MKPRSWYLPVLLSPALLAPLVGVLADESGNRPQAEQDLLAALPPSTERVWVQVKQPVSIEELSSQLHVDESGLARLNNVDEDHRFFGGEWLAVPSKRSAEVGRLASLNAEQLRRTPPVEAPPPLVSSAVVRFGDTLQIIAQRYGMTVRELLQLNPGIEAVGLVVGSQVRLAQAGPGRVRTLLAMQPSTSGGISWPELPGFAPTRSNAPPVFNPDSVIGGNWIWPAEGVFSSGYGWRWGRMHRGIDVANNVGTPIRAAQGGRVTFAGWHDGGYGYLVEITHPDGSLTRYGHNSQLMVREGEEVSQGQVISAMGSTGRSTGPHLHFEIHPPGQGAVNPLQFLPPRA
ncbi:MAG: peptidoglycan DD-metalloendopeptidase family protein [Cyanobacteriota bacterium]